MVVIHFIKDFWLPT